MPGVFCYGAGVWHYGIPVRAGGGPACGFTVRAGPVLCSPPPRCIAPALCLSRFPCKAFSLLPSLRGFITLHRQNNHPALRHTV